MGSVGSSAAADRTGFISVNELTVVCEGVHAGRHETVGHGNPVGAAVDDLAVRCPDVVVFAVKLDKARRSENAVLVVIEASEFRHDTVLDFGLIFAGLNFGRIQHPAVLTELIQTDGQEIVGHGDPVAPAVDDLAVGGPDVVVSTVKLDETSRGTIPSLT